MVTRKTRLMSALLAILMVVSMLTAFVLPAVAEDADLSSYPSITEYDADADVKDYTVSTVEEWNSISALGMTYDHTIHIAADLDFEGAATTVISKLQANIDGHGHTISNIANTNNPLFLYHYGLSFKNLNFVNCSRVLGETSETYTALLFGNIWVARNSTMVVEDITMVNCSMERTTSNVNGTALLIGGYNANKNLVLRNITIDSCSLTTKGGWGFGLLVAKAGYDNGSPNISIDGLVVKNNVLNAASGTSGCAVLIGEYSPNAVGSEFKNIAVFNNECSAVALPVFINNLKTDGVAPSLNNVLIAGNTNLSGVTNGTLTSATDVYSDVAYNDAVYTTEQVLCGEAAYTANQSTATGVKKWEYLPGATCPTLDTDGAGLPFPVTVNVTDGNTAAPSTMTAYTDTEGRLIAPISVILTSDADTVYTAGGTETATATAWPLASAYADNTTSLGFIINSVAELNAAVTNTASFTADQTLYVTKDLGLSGASFAGFSSLKASFDGGNHTISNWSTTYAGMFRSYAGATIKDLTLENVHTAGGEVAVLATYAGNADLKITNVHLIDCSATCNGSDSWRSGGLLSRMDDAGKAVTIENCSIIGTTLKTADNITVNGNMGLIVGQPAYSGSKYTVKNVLVKDSVVDVDGNCTTGVAFGGAEQGSILIAENITILNSTLAGTLKQGGAGIFLGGAKGAASVTASDIVIQGCTQAVAVTETGYGSGAGIAIGRVHDQNTYLALNNFAVLDSVRENGKTGYYETGILIGHVYGNDNSSSTADPEVDLKNIILLGNKNTNAEVTPDGGNINGGSGRADFAESTAANCFYQTKTFISSSLFVNKTNWNASMTADDYAMIAYTVNNDADLAISDTETITSTNKWKVTADGALAVATDSVGLPLEITLEITDELNDEVITAYAYTDVNGKLVGVDDYLAKNYFWEKELTSTFTAEETVKGRMLTYTDLKNKVEYFTGKDSQYFTNGTDTTYDAELARIKEKVDAYSYTAQADIQADYAILAAYEYKEGLTFPVSQYATYPDAPVFTISTVDELNLAQTNSANFAETQTLKLLNDLDLEGAELHGFRSLKASFDGGNNTISNGTLATNIAFFNTYQGTSIKDLTLKGITAKNTSTGNEKGLLINKYTLAKTLNLENVHLDGCTFTIDTTAGVYHVGMMIGHTTSATVNVTNCSITGSKMTHGDNVKNVDNSGLVFGTVRGGATVNVTDFKLLNNELSIYVHQDALAGIFAGSVEKSGDSGTLNVNNLLMQGNVRKNVGLGWNNRGMVVGYVKDMGKVRLYNVIAIDNDNGTLENYWADHIHGDKTAEEWLAWNPMTNIYSSADAENSNISHVYSDDSLISSGGTANIDGTSKANITADDYAAIAYAINNNLTVTIDDATTLTSATKYEVTAAGALVIDEDGVGLPVAVTFEGVDPVNAENNVNVALYTKADGTLVGLTEELLAAADWAKEVDATTVFAAAETIKGDIMPEHEHTFGDYIDNENGTHTPACSAEWDSVKGGTFGCEETASEAESCTYGEWKETQAPTTEKEGEKERTCELCGYVDTAKVPVLMSITVADTDGYVGGEMVLDVDISGNTGIGGGKLTVTYDANLLEWKGVELIGEVNNGSGDLEIEPVITDGVGVVTFATLLSETYMEADLMTLTFTVKAIGEAAIKIAPEFADIGGEEVGCAEYEGTFTIHDFIRGDVNNDKALNIADAVLLLRLVNNDQELNKENLNEEAADVNGNNTVEITDVIRVLQFLCDAISEL